MWLSGEEPSGGKRSKGKDLRWGGAGLLRESPQHTECISQWEVIRPET